MLASQMTFGGIQTKTTSLLKRSYIKGINDFQKRLFANFFLFTKCIASMHQMLSKHLEWK